MSKTEKLIALEGAIIDLVSAIQKGDTMLSDKIEAVDEAARKFPNWAIGIYEEEGS